MKLLCPPIVPLRAGIAASIFLIFLGFPGVRAHAWRPAQFAAGVSLVEVYASVVDLAGVPVTGLRAEDFTVEEDGVRQRVELFTAGEFPLALAVGLDRSFSMTGPRLAAAASAVRGLVGQLRADDQVMLLAIGSQAEVLAPLSTDRGALSQALGRVEPWGTTPLYDATASAVDAIQAARGRRALILLSDGTDRYSTLTAGQAIDHARSRDVLIYPVALGREQPAVFAELAVATGGRSFHARDTNALPGILSTIARDLRNQYLLGYTPAARADERDSWRSIRVGVSRPNVRVRARAGYRSGRD